MVKHPREIPVTYLNKGQMYTLSVVDSSPPPVGPSTLIRYRTYVRISFEEEEQRSRVASCWQLWKEGRGLSEAHQRGGKLLAVELVDPMPGNGQNQIQLESASFDGFCVTWTADATTGVSFCALCVRFNFLSTDFSHSKGVKGVPVRLCAKTELISPSQNESAITAAAPGEGSPKVAYCKVKLFRDHGAERKLANDVAHVKKGIEKLKQQIAQAELGANGFGKRKRGSIPAARPSKFLKHNRSWSAMDQQQQPPQQQPPTPTAVDGSADTTSSTPSSLDDDIHVRLNMMQGMFSSTRPVSILNLRGDEQDDPDLYPVTLPSDDLSNNNNNNNNLAIMSKSHMLRHQSTQESLSSVDAPPSMTTTLSPTNSTISLSSPHKPSFVRSDSGYHSSRENNPSFSEESNKGRFLDQPVKISKISGGMDSSLDAVDIDPTYQPPAECIPRPGESIYPFLK